MDLNITIEGEAHRFRIVNIDPGGEDEPSVYEVRANGDVYYLETWESAVNDVESLAKAAVLAVAWSAVDSFEEEK